MTANSVKKIRPFHLLSPIVTLLACILFSSVSVAGNTNATIEQGKQIAFDRKKGNCLACHSMDDGTLAGNGGPPLIAMKARYPDASKLRDQIWDATQRNPNSIMPPFGRHGILTEDEIDKVTAYLLTL